MPLAVIILLCLTGAALLAALGLLLWIWASPVPAVLLLRRGREAPPEYPEDYDRRKAAVTIYRDLVYPSSSGRNRLDLYLPQNAAGPLPVVLWAHGGAFVAGRKEGLENWAVCLASEGLAVAAVEYQWAPEAHWPAQVRQLCEACAFLQGQAGRYGLDMEHVAVAGDSAGAHMAAQFALIHGDGPFSVESGLAPVLAPHALRAALLYCGPYDIGQMARPENKMLRFFIGRIGWSYLGEKHWQNTPQAALTVIRDYITGQFPPLYITDGNAFSFESQGRALADALREKGVLVQSRFFEKEAGQVPHEYQFALARPNAWLCYEDTVAFLQRQGLLS